MLDKTTSKRIIAEKTARFMDGSFGQLDLFAFPDLNSPPPEDKQDQRFAREYGGTALFRSASALRRFLADPDIDALERVGAEIGNPGLLADVRDRRAEAIVLEFKRSRPDNLATNPNYCAMIRTLAYNSPLSPSEQSAKT